MSDKCKCGHIKRFHHRYGRGEALTCDVSNCACGYYEPAEPSPEVAPMQRTEEDKARINAEWLKTQTTWKGDPPKNAMPFPAVAPRETQQTKEKSMTTEEKLAKAMDLLQRVEASETVVNKDFDWYRDFYLLTGEHMVRTDEGWQDGDCKTELVAEYGADAIEDEVNAPEAVHAG